MLIYIYIYNLYYTLIFNIDDLPIPHGDFPTGSGATEVLESRLSRLTAASTRSWDSSSVHKQIYIYIHTYIIHMLYIYIYI